MIEPGGKTQAQVVEEVLTEAHQQSDIGRQVEADDGVVVANLYDVGSMGDVVSHFAAELTALKAIVKSQAAAIDRLNGVG